MYDNTCKLLIGDNPLDFTTWLLGKVLELDERIEPSELYFDPIRADGVVLLKNANIICHWEFQTDPDEWMAYRMLDYYVRLLWKYPGCEILQTVVYLRKTGSDRVFVDKYEEVRLSQGIKRTVHEFNVVRLWEEKPENLMGLPGLLPFAVLSDTPNEVETLRRVADLIADVPDVQRRSNLMASAAIFAGLKLDVAVINQILRQDAMKGSVIYDQIFQEGEARGEARGEVRGKRDLLVKLLTQRVGVLSVEMLGQIEGLSLERVEELGVALLDFGSVDDLVFWLG
jgi:predicted transposase YdaD